MAASGNIPGSRESRWPRVSANGLRGIMNFMFCRSCRYGLWGIPSGPCPECGRPFSPHDPRSYVQHSHPVLFQVLIGLGCSVLLVVVMASLFWLVFGLNYGERLVNRPGDHASEIFLHHLKRSAADKNTLGHQDYNKNTLCSFVLG